MGFCSIWLLLVGGVTKSARAITSGERGKCGLRLKMSISGHDVFALYGQENRKELREIQRKHDAEGVFSKLQPGYFHV